MKYNDIVFPDYDINSIQLKIGFSAQGFWMKDLGKKNRTKFVLGRIPF